MSVVPNVWWTKMPLGTEVGLGLGHIVLDGDPAPPETGHSPHFSAHVYCEQTAGWIKMPLRMKVGLALGNIVLDADPAPPARGTAPPQAPPQFSAHVCCGQTAGWIKMPLGTKVGLGPGHMCYMGTQRSGPAKKKGHSPPIFGPCFL